MKESDHMENITKRAIEELTLEFGDDFDKQYKLIAVRRLIEKNMLIRRENSRYVFYINDELGVNFYGKPSKRKSRCDGNTNGGI